MMIIGCDLHTRYQQIAMAGGPSYREAKGGECYRSNVQPSQRNHRRPA